MVCGTEVNGTVVRAAQASLGRSLSVSNYSQYPDFAYCYIQFATAPIVSAFAVSKTTGLFDCYRNSHIENPVVKDAYPAGFPPILLQNMKVGRARLFHSGAARNTRTPWTPSSTRPTPAPAKPKEALENVAQEWEKITKRQGREGQIARWKELRDFYPEAFRKVAG